MLPGNFNCERCRRQYCTAKFHRTCFICSQLFVPKSKRMRTSIMFGLRCSEARRCVTIQFKTSMVVLTLEWSSDLSRLLSESDSGLSSVRGSDLGSLQ
eukprot:IDg9805t1